MVGRWRLKIEDIDVDAALASVRQGLKTEKGLSPALRASLEVLLLLVTLLLNRITLNSRNSAVAREVAQSRVRSQQTPPPIRTGTSAVARG